MTTLVALHDLNLAAAYCDEVYVLTHGWVVAAGTPGDVLTRDLIAEVYGVEARVRQDSGQPLNIQFLPQGGRQRADQGVRAGPRLTGTVEGTDENQVRWERHREAGDSR